MRFKLLTLTLIMAMLAAVTPAAAQHYKLHAATNGVKVEINRKIVAATVGMTLKATDNLIIPAGGEASVYNTLDKRIYTSVRPGKLSVTKLMIEARDEATDKLSGLAEKINIGRKGGNSGKRVHDEKGMVNRQCEVYDPQAADSIEAGNSATEIPDSIVCPMRCTERPDTTKTSN